MNEGVRAEALTENEKFVQFERMQSYVVPAGKKHQIVHNQGQEDIGIAISSNCRADFRKHKSKTVYWYTEPYAYITLAPMENHGITIDLSHLV